MRPFLLRLGLLGGLVAFVAGAGGCSSSETFTPPADPMVGTAAPPFVFHGVGAHRISFPSENFKGKTLLLVFIRPGQPDLQLLLREIEKTYRDPAYADTQFMVLTPEDDPLSEPFWTGLRNSLPIALDYTGAAARFGAGSLPMVVVRDHRGIIRLRLDGYLGPDLLPRLEATRKILRQVEAERTRPGG